MKNEVFSIVSLSESKSGEWVVEGRAYADVRIGDLLSVSPESTTPLRVTGIVTYGKKTVLLSRMMTGRLYLQGVMRPKEKAATCLYHLQPGV
jgi:hypothetical protein